MPIFRVIARDDSASLVVRARCISCARQLAAEHSAAEEFALWCQASVQWVADPERQGYVADGTSGIIKRINHG